MERQDSKKTRNIPSRSPSPSSEDAKQRSSALSRLLFSEESPFVRRTEVSKWSAVVFVLVFTLFLRYLISVHSYSGMNSPPMYGDYEAQRHWMEITLHLPASEWYHHLPPANDLQYWGLDYPPLTAHISYIFGIIGSFLEPESMELISSHGYQSPTSKLFMRATVIICDLLFFFPAAFLFARGSFSSALHRWILPIILLIQPALILIDHGHFHYNCVSLGLSLWAIYFVLQDRDITGSILFSLALNYKQISLYFALPFFFFLFGKTLRSRKGVLSITFRLATLALAVLATFTLCWAPFFTGPDWINGVLQVLHRIFPVARGLYEDKVASFWCAVSPFIKFKQLIEVPRMVKICMITTLVAAVPANLHLLYRPTGRNFLLCLASTSLAFFMFAFHAHEKSILFPLLPLNCMFFLYPRLIIHMNIVSAFSMYPLLEKDGLALPYCAVVYLIYLPIGTMIANELKNSSEAKKEQDTRKKRSNKVFDQPLKSLLKISLCGILVLHLLRAFVPCPTKLPDLWDLAISCYSFAHFFGVYVVLLFVQFSSNSNII